MRKMEGKVGCRVEKNDGAKENFSILTGLKNVLQQRLPKMARKYSGVVRLPFYKQNSPRSSFASTGQVRGYGAHLMNHPEDYVKSTSHHATTQMGVSGTRASSKDIVLSHYLLMFALEILSSAL